MNFGKNEWINFCEKEGLEEGWEENEGIKKGGEKK